MSKLRLGIVGAGGIAVDRHIPAFQKHANDVEVFAICDIDIDKAKQVATVFQIPHVFRDYYEMFSKVDAVVICTSNKFHAEITVAALNASVHVLCEKPMAMSVEECQSMVEAYKQSNKVLTIGYHYRFMKEALAAKRLMEAGEIGDPLVVRIQALRRRKVPGWGVFTNKTLQGGGSLIDYGCHLIDLALWLTGNPKPIAVMGSTYNQLSKIPGQVNLWGEFDHESFNVDDHVTGYITFENGMSLLLEVSWAANIDSDKENISISGVQGGIDVFPFHFNYAKHGMLFNSKALWIPGSDDPGYLQARQFVDACLGKEVQVVKPEEAMQVSQIIEAIYESDKTRTSVEFNSRGKGY
jgi:predicted dehydrogenase